MFSFDNLTSEQVEKYKKDFWRNANNPEKISRNIFTSDGVKQVGLEVSNLSFG